MKRESGRRYLLLLAAILFLTAVVYWPSFNGGYVFDDYPNIVDNAPVHITDLNWTSLRAAAMASPAKDLVRPLSMLSFGMDWYFGDGNPHRMKVVNLSIHLVNGILIFFLIWRISNVANRRQKPVEIPENLVDVLALCVTAAWLFSPINFTAVGYIVQRMESLCQVFVFAGLLGYISARERMFSLGTGVALPALALVVCTGLGLLAKESAALLPVYAFITEWCLFGFRQSSGKTDKRIYAMYGVVLIAPAVSAAAWILIHYVPSAAWVNRTFTLSERLLTEPRIISDYALWTLLPLPNWLALYHDNIALSRSFLDPPTTIASIAFLLVTASSAFFLKASRPLVAIGIFWFLSAQLLTGTVVPLELAFEHRNYFASAGIYLAIFSCLVSSRSSIYIFARATACVALLVLFATVTWIRAMDWGNPVAFAMSEVEKNPDSPRTAYELGRTYVVLSNYRSDSQSIPLAYASLEHAATMRGADALPDQALLILSANLKRPISVETWPRLQDKLRIQPLSVQNIAALYSLTQCSIKGICDFPSQDMIGCFTAALSHDPPDTAVLSIYANYAFNVMHDVPFAIDLAKIAVAEAPRDLQLRLNLLALLATGGFIDDAVQLYQQTALEIPRARDDPRYLSWQTLLNKQERTDPR